MVYGHPVPWMFSELLVFWGSCEAATSESTTCASFNKQSPPISKPLSQTNSMIKRHTSGEPRGNLPFSLSLRAALFVYFYLSFVFYLLIFSPGLGWEEYSAMSPPWLDSTISCRDNLTLSYARVFHFLPRTQWHRSISYTANRALCHPYLSTSISLLFSTSQHTSLGWKISVCSGQCSYFFPSWGEFTCTPQDEWLERSRREIAVVKQYDLLLPANSWMDRLKIVNGRCEKANRWK